MASQKYLLIIGGPTAAGKTNLAIRLAQHYRTEVLSADSRQFYREMQIGTAPPTVTELAAAPHHFVGHLSIHDSYSVGDFERAATQLLQKLFQDRDLVIMVGGSGLFIKAVCEGLDVFPEVPISIRTELQQKYELEGLAGLQKELQKVDPDYFELVDQQNPMRLLRALEVYRASGQPFSSFRTQQKSGRPFQPIYLQVHWDRDTLYDRINRRVDQMLAEGLEEEAESLHEFRGVSALETVGYQEFFDFFEGVYNREEAIRLIKRNTRRYAKRQLTWMRRDGFWKKIRSDEVDMAIQYIEWVRTNQGEFMEIPPHTLPEPMTQENFEASGQKYLNLQSRTARLLLPFRESTHGRVYGPPIFSGVEPDLEMLAILLHEMKLRGANNTFVIFPPAYEPFLQERGFHTIAAGTLPKWVTWWQTELDLPNVYAFRS